MIELKAYKGDVTIPVYGTIADAEVYLKKDADAVIAELKQKLEDARREVNNYRRHANECEGLAAKGDIDKVSLLEEIKDLKNDKELLDSQLYGFLQLEEECGGGDLRNYIAELKKKLEDAKATAYTESVDAGMENRRLERALWLARAELCRRLDVDRYLRNHRNSWYNENCLTWAEACVAMEVKMCKAESKCRAKADEFGG